MAKTYLPKSNIKTRDTSFGPVLKLSCNGEALIAFVKEHTNERGYINFEIVERKEVGEYGESHSIYLDDWKPSDRGGESAGKPATRTKQAPRAKPNPTPEAAEEDIPF